MQKQEVKRISIEEILSENKLLNYRNQFYLREISKLSKIPLKTTQRVLGYLENLRILKSRLHGKNKYFQLNLENIETKLYLLQSEIYKTMVFLDKYPLFRSFIKDIEISVQIIVFGSFAKFKADKNSDVDILLISEKEAKPPFHLLPYKVHEIRMSEKEFAKGVETKETFIKEIEENHIMLNSHSYFVNIMWDEYAE